MTLEERRTQLNDTFIGLERERTALLQRVQAIEQDMLRVQGAYKLVEEMLNAQEGDAKEDAP